MVNNAGSRGECSGFHGRGWNRPDGTYVDLPWHGKSWCSPDRSLRLVIAFASGALRGHVNDNAEPTALQPEIAYGHAVAAFFSKLDNPSTSDYIDAAIARNLPDNEHLKK